MLGAAQVWCARGRGCLAHPGRCARREVCHRVVILLCGGLHRPVGRRTIDRDLRLLHPGALDFLRDGDLGRETLLPPPRLPALRFRGEGDRILLQGAASICGATGLP
jgi:hypothetical protein